MIVWTKNAIPQFLVLVRILNFDGKALFIEAL